MHWKELDILASEIFLVIVGAVAQVCGGDDALEGVCEAGVEECEVRIRIFMSIAFQLSL